MVVFLASLLADKADGRTPRKHLTLSGGTPCLVETRAWGREAVLPAALRWL